MQSQPEPAPHLRFGAGPNLVYEVCKPNHGQSICERKRIWSSNVARKQPDNKHVRVQVGQLFCDTCIPEDYSSVLLT